MDRLVLLTMLLIMVSFPANAAQSDNPADSAASTPRAFTDISGDPREAQILAVTGLRLMQGHPDKTFRPTSTLTVADLTAVVDRLLVGKPGLRKPEVSEPNPSQPVTRARAIAVLARCHVPPEEIDEVSNADYVLSAYSDASAVPEWARKPLAYLVSKRIMPSEPALRPNALITRSELAGMLAACMGMCAEEPANPNGYTGLLVDCRGMDARRCMSVTLKDADGNQIYPDPKNIPPDDIMMEEGLVSFTRDAGSAKRCGGRPFVAKAIGVSGKTGNVLNLSNHDCAALLAAEKTDKFLANWKVVVLVGPAPESVEAAPKNSASSVAPADTGEKPSEEPEPAATSSQPE